MRPNFMILADNFATGTTVAEGDFNFDGAVDLFDFVGFKEAFGGVQGQAAVVPEPAGLTIIAMACCALLAARRRLN